MQKKQNVNRRLSAIKKTLPEYCVVCGRKGCDLAHLLPRSLYPEYITEEWNLVIMCRECHVRYDNEREFRRGCLDLVERVKQHDQCAANRYFGL